MADTSITAKKPQLVSDTINKLIQKQILEYKDLAAQQAELSA